MFDFFMFQELFELFFLKILLEVPRHFLCHLDMLSPLQEWAPRRLHHRIFSLSTFLPHTCIKHTIYSNVEDVVYYNIMRVGYLHSPQRHYLCIKLAPLIELIEMLI